MTKPSLFSSNSPSLKTIFVTLIVLLALGIPRLKDAYHYVMVDEPLWLYRSANFLNALKQQSWINTYQINHPGVITMWVGASGLFIFHPEVYQAQTKQLNLRQFESLLSQLNVSPLDILATDRRLIGLVITIVLGIAFLYTSGLIGLSAASLGFLLIAFDPFQLALSRILHLDGLLSSFML
ncbi:MAG: hypothetical protein ACPL3P_04285, partial [Anaerolineales bacterium]